MTRRFWITNVLAAGLLGVVAFGVSLGVGSSSTGSAVSSKPAEEVRVGRWLGGNEEAAKKILAADPNYRTELRQLGEETRRQREELARVLKQADSSDQAVQAQLEKVIAAQNALERRVVNHVLKIRQHIPPEQRTWLLRTMAHQLGEKGGRPGGEGGRGAWPPRRKPPESGPAQPGPWRDRGDRGHRSTSRPADSSPAPRP